MPLSTGRCFPSPWRELTCGGVTRPRPSLALVIRSRLWCAGVGEGRGAGRWSGVLPGRVVVEGWSAGVEDDGGGDVCQSHDQGGGGIRTGVEHRELGGLVLPDSGDRFTYLLLHPLRDPPALGPAGAVEHQVGHVRRRSGRTAQRGAVRARPRRRRSSGSRVDMWMLAHGVQETAGGVRVDREWRRPAVRRRLGRLTRRHGAPTSLAGSAQPQSQAGAAQRGPATGQPTDP